MAIVGFNYLHFIDLYEKYRFKSMRCLHFIDLNRCKTSIRVLSLHTNRTI